VSRPRPRNRRRGSHRAPHHRGQAPFTAGTSAPGRRSGPGGAGARAGVPTVPGTQATAGRRFGVQVQPAPDFILHDGSTARGLLECKSAGDGGTARDKAGRFGALRREAQRLGGIPALAVLEGLGWRRLNDALGPVVRDCDGRVFIPGNLSDLLDVDPVRDLIGTAT